METYLGGRYEPREDRGRYSVVWDESDPSTTIGEITVGWYWALMLNSQQVMFVDVDSRHLLTGILSIADKPIIDDADDTNLDLPGGKLKSFLEANEDYGFRVYQTFGGYRYVCITHEHAPAGKEAAAVFKSLGADKRYAKLCRKCKTFRARLTAKPWRMLGKSFLPWTYKHWGKKNFSPGHIRDYLGSADGFAACRYIRTVGRTPKALSPRIRQIIALHDELSGALEVKPLA